VRRSSAAKRGLALPGAIRFYRNNSGKTVLSPTSPKNPPSPKTPGGLWAHRGCRDFDQTDGWARPLSRPVTHTCPLLFRNTHDEDRNRGTGAFESWPRALSGKNGHWLAGPAWAWGNRADVSAPRRQFPHRFLRLTLRRHARPLPQRRQKRAIFSRRGTLRAGARPVEKALHSSLGCTGHRPTSTTMAPGYLRPSNRAASTPSEGRIQHTGAWCSAIHGVK